jgi:hypothetical protein
MPFVLLVCYYTYIAIRIVQISNLIWIQNSLHLKKCFENIIGFLFFISALGILLFLTYFGPVGPPPLFPFFSLSAVAQLPLLSAHSDPLSHGPLGPNLWCSALDIFFPPTPGAHTVVPTSPDCPGRASPMRALRSPRHPPSLCTDLRFFGRPRLCTLNALSVGSLRVWVKQKLKWEFNPIHNKPLMNLWFGCRMDSGWWSACARTLSPIKGPPWRPHEYFSPPPSSSEPAATAKTNKSLTRRTDPRRSCPKPHRRCRNYPRSWNSTRGRPLCRSRSEKRGCRRKPIPPPPQPREATSKAPCHPYSVLS